MRSLYTTPASRRHGPLACVNIPLRQCDQGSHAQIVSHCPFARSCSPLFLAIWLLFVVCSASSSVGQSLAEAAKEDSAAFSAAGIGTGTRPIAGLWQFHLGDDPAWAKPGFDDRGWERLPADQPWGEVGHTGAWGYGWYRRQLTLDPNSKQPLALLLPALDSVAEVYWNGVKIGSEGTMPPHPNWFRTPQPVAIPLPAMNGASSGVLAIRMWVPYTEASDLNHGAGPQGPFLLGSRSLIQKMPDAWAEHKLRTRMIGNVLILLMLITALVSLVLWTRFRSHWVLLCVGLFFGGYVVTITSLYLMTSTSFVASSWWGSTSTTVTQLCCIWLILLLADLPRRSGVKGFRFWARICLTVACVGVAQWALGQWSDLVVLRSLSSPGSPLPLTMRFANHLNSFYNAGFPVFVLTLLAVCLVLSRWTAPRIFFMASLALDTGLQFLGRLASDASSHFSVLHPILFRPLLQIDGSVMSNFTASRALVLVAVVYAVWDQLSQQLKRQRFVNAELHAAQEIQQVLVPAVMEREAPGYAVASVYRPASEVGGDFFQIISLEGNGTGDGTLIVAGDVSGKGLRAAMTVSLVVGALRTLAEYDSEPAAVLAGLNRRLIGRTQGGFVTCCAVRIDSAGHATMANAGHCQPYLDGHEIELPNGLPLGIVEDAEYEEVAVEVPHGQQLTLMSDGVVEARNNHGELYGFDRLNRLMLQRPTAEHVADTAASFGQDDDITVLTVTRLAHA